MMSLFGNLVKWMCVCLPLLLGSSVPTEESEPQASVRITDVASLPEFEMGDSVEFYFIEGAFPFTTPPEIRSMLGENWNKYSLSHAGLGIWNKDSGVKYSLEIVCWNYSAALFPNVVNATTMVWHNDAVIVMTQPIDEVYWSESRLVAVSNGAAYEYLRTYLIEEAHDKYSVYQPVSLNCFDPAAEDNLGKAVIPFLDSYEFTFDLLRELTSYAVKLDAFLGVERTGWSYLVETESSPLKLESEYLEERHDAFADEGKCSASVLSWEGDVPLNVTTWYSDLKKCYEDVFSSTQGGTITISSLTECYESGYAFVYASPKSVYQVYLEVADAKDDAYFAPVLWRHDTALPTEDSNDFVGWNFTDIMVSSTVIFLLFSFLGLFLAKQCCLPRERRRQSKLWEAEAIETVQKAIGGGSENDSIDTLEQSYFHRKSSDRQSQQYGILSFLNPSVLYELLAKDDRAEDTDRTKPYRT